MKNKLNEQVSRIKDMMKKINEQSFEDKPSSVMGDDYDEKKERNYGVEDNGPVDNDEDFESISHEEFNKLVDMAVEKMSPGDFDIDHTKYGIKGRLPVRVDLDEKRWYEIEFKFTYSIDADEDGPTSSTSISVELSDNSDDMAQELSGYEYDDVFSDLSPETQRRIESNIDEIIDEYNEEDSYRDDYDRYGVNRRDFM